MRAIDRKVWRDLWDSKGQVVAISLVMACGIATFVMSLSTLDSLVETRATYYDRYRFADIFAHLKRAPMTLADRLREIPGVAQVQPRIVMEVTLDIPNLREPAVGRLISVPDRQTPGLNDIYLRRGRYIDPEQPGEALVGEMLAEAHDMQLGDQISAIINGRQQWLTIVGVALSPEYVLQIKPGELLPDQKRFGIFWMSETQLAAAFDMDGAFNDVTLSLMRDANEQEVLDRVDDLIEPYGGIGAYGREDQLSNRYLSDEIRQLQGMGQVAPTIFLSVAAFLLNVVVGRLIKAQREQIAALKAFGYSKFEIGMHYAQYTLVIIVLGSGIGAIAGSWFGYSLTRMYTQFYKFPLFAYQLDMRILLSAMGISLAAAALGVQSSLRSAMNLPPAEAMRPEPPASFRPTLIERLRLGSLLSNTGRMILRHIERKPLKAAMSCLGISMAVAVLILGSFSEDALDYLIDFQFRQAQRQDLTVTFVEPTNVGVKRELEQLPGVFQTQFFRAVPTRMRSAHRSRRVGLVGIESNELYRLLDDRGQAIQPPSTGVMLSDKLAEILHCQLGDAISVEILEGQRQTRQLQVTAIIREFSGTNAYMSLPAIHALLEEGPHVSGCYLKVRTDRLDVLYEQLKQTPRVSSVRVKIAALQSFQDTIAENLGRMRFFNVLFAMIIAIGVVYNGARISFAERSRELATLRVIGFTRSEVAFLLLGEFAILTSVAIPLGMLIGYALAYWASLGLDTEMYRIPLVVKSSTYAFATIVVFVASILSAISIWGRIQKLDLVGVLKTRE